MAKKGVNEKVVAANERKAASENAKAQKKNAIKETMEQEEWAAGAKDSSRKAVEEQKRLEKLAKKAEREALLEQEEKIISAKKPLLSRGLEKSAQKKELKLEEFTNNTEEVEKFTASNLDDAIELLSLATESTGKTVDLLDRHPERRVKSAYAVFEEREMAILKEENPSLRMTQLKQLLQKKWKKSPENPMNQQSLAYNSTREDEMAALQMKRQDSLNKFKQ